jgi:hypothetical protein
MKKVILLVVTCAVLISLVAGSTVMAAGKSNEKLDLYEKDPTTWEIVEDGAWGKLRYNLAGEEFEYGFIGHGLESNTDYSLIYYPEPQITWPWGVTVIDSGMTNNGGNINLAGSIDLEGDLDGPADEYNPDGGAKIWLVLTADINAEGKLDGWNPIEYLFENNLISYEDTDD